MKEMIYFPKRLAQTLADEQVVPRERYENVLENLKAVLAERGEEDAEIH